MLEIVDLKELKEHEEVEPIYLQKIKKQIQKDGILKRPIVVDKNTKIIIDGHFRFNALKQLGYSKVPVFFIDYNSTDITVAAWRDGEIVTKEDVIKAGLNGKKLPPKTSKHMLIITNQKIRISKIEKKIDIPLNKLNGGN
jgi:ParB-like chromosome segregation protein Spo0J